jgi:hypothetical protein
VDRGAPEVAHRLDQPAHALAAGADGQWGLAAHGEALTLLDADARVRKTFDGSDLARRVRGRAAQLVAHAGRRSFVASWPALGELWEISLDPAAPPIFDGLVHDYRMGEAIPTSGFLGIRRAPLPRAVPELAFADPRASWVAGTLGDAVVVVHLDVRRTIATFALPLARPAAAALRPAAGTAAQWWLPVQDEVHVIATDRWVEIDRHRFQGAVQRVQAVGDTIWALVGEPGNASLQVWRDGRWSALEVGAKRLVALRALPAQGAVLLAAREPDALLLVGTQGQVQHRWAWPGAAGARGLAEVAVGG